MKKYLLIIGMLVLPLVSYADCMFKILNYADSPVTVKIGFYRGESEEFIAEPATTSIRSLHSQYACNGSSIAGLGVVYVSFPKDPDHAGAIYLPRSGTIKLQGDFTGTPDGRLMRADNGTTVWLNTTDLAIDAETFQLKLNFTGRPNSFVAGTQ